MRWGSGEGLLEGRVPFLVKLPVATGNLGGDDALVKTKVTKNDLDRGTLILNALTQIVKVS